MKRQIESIVREYAKQFLETNIPDKRDAITWSASMYIAMVCDNGEHLNQMAMLYVGLIHPQTPVRPKTEEWEDKGDWRDCV